MTKLRRHARHGHNDKNGCVMARKFDSKGNAVSEFLEPPASFIAARTFVLNGASPPSVAAGWIHLFNLCASAAILKIMFLFKGLVAERPGKLSRTIAA
jgi:hypothetical protein